jgi:hypothetical protein
MPGPNRDLGFHPNAAHVERRYCAAPIGTWVRSGGCKAIHIRVRPCAKENAIKFERVFVPRQSRQQPKAGSGEQPDTNAGSSATHPRPC